MEVSNNCEWDHVYFYDYINEDEESNVLERASEYKPQQNEMVYPSIGSIRIYIPFNTYLDV